MTFLALIAVAIVSYLIGSIPTGYLAGRLAGVDIRQVGSGNVGATNVTRVLGKRYGYPVFLVDFLKGFGAVSLAAVIATQRAASPELSQLFQLVAAAFSVVGHTVPVWLRFRGGKGVATSAGALFGMMPWAALVAIIVWIITFKITRYVSLSSMIAALSLPIIVAIVMRLRGTNEKMFLYFSVAITAIIILRHRSNLLRLMRGSEPRFRK